MEEIEIGSIKIYSPKVHLSCKDRVWVGNKPHCTRDTGCAINVTETDVEYAPFCTLKQCFEKKNLCQKKY